MYISHAARQLMHKTTAERTDEELEEAYQAYVCSKCVNGRFCPTPDFTRESSEDEAAAEEDSLVEQERQNKQLL